MANFATVREYDVKGCKANAPWRLRLRKNPMSGVHEVEIHIWCRDNSCDKVRIPASDRANPRRFLTKLDEHNARLPKDELHRTLFVKQLMQSIPNTPYISTLKTGWDKSAEGFVMPHRMYGSAKGAVLWEDDSAAREYGNLAGSLEAYKNGVLVPACQSTFLTGAILITLGATLPGYVKGRLNKSLLSETAVYHWAGESSAGKTTLARVSQSVLGAPDNLCDYRTSLRGAAEEAHARNDLVAVFDEAEHDDAEPHAVLHKMKTICQWITSGRSRQISASARGALPSLTWTCFGISTGPITQAGLFEQLNKSKHGQAARFFDLSVPPPQDGGIFDRMAARDGVALHDRSAGLVKKVESTISTNHGLLLDSWIEYLLEYDSAQRVYDLTDRFAFELSREKGGVTGRVARKFAVLLAAAELGIEAGLLPWSTEWVLHAVRSLYQNALENRDPKEAQVTATVHELLHAIRDETLFPRVRMTRRGVPTFELSERALGLTLIEAGQNRRVYLIPARLERLGIIDASLQRRIAERIRTKVVRGQSSTQFDVRDASGRERRVRAWRLSRIAMDEVCCRGGST